MRTVACDTLGPVSALGFGCASLGSRISEKAGRAAIERALAAGVTWFDVAPSYGDGKAEEILGQALRGSQAAILTKVGLVAPAGNPVKRMVGMVARPLISAVPALRPLAKKLRPDAARRLPLDAETIRVSILQSLERLGRQSVSVLALHDPSLDDVSNEAVIRALSDIRDEGLAGKIAIAGSVEAFNAARLAGLPCEIAQFGHSPFGAGMAKVEPPRPFKVIHSVFGVSGALARLSKLSKTGAGAKSLADLGYANPADLLLDYAFAANPHGVVLASSYGAGHLATNVAAASKTPDPTLVARVDAWLKTVSAA